MSPHWHLCDCCGCWYRAITCPDDPGEDATIYIPCQELGENAIGKAVMSGGVCYEVVEELNELPSGESETTGVTVFDGGCPECVTGDPFPCWFNNCAACGTVRATLDNVVWYTTSGPEHQGTIWCRPDLYGVGSTDVTTGSVSSDLQYSAVETDCLAPPLDTFCTWGYDRSGIWFDEPFPRWCCADGGNGFEAWPVATSAVGHTLNLFQCPAFCGLCCHDLCQDVGSFVQVPIDFEFSTLTVGCTLGSSTEWGININFAGYFLNAAETEISSCRVSSYPEHGAANPAFIIETDSQTCPDFILNVDNFAGEQIQFRLTIEHLN